MKAVIYSRVSTDEQALGFSLKDQRARLEEHCHKGGWKVEASFEDDFTGKTFNRPGFNSLLKFIKSNRVELVLFTKWSRFSRNTTDAYQMIRELKELGAGVQAIDEPIDLNISQNKLLLAFYLSLPEVDNDLRADATVRGTRRAAKEGRYTNMAPFGYKNVRDDSGKPTLSIVEEKAAKIRIAFDMAATGKYSQDKIRQEVGFSRSQLSKRLQNPLYAGLIILTAYKDEPAQIITGIHEPIITQEQFYHVQEVLTGKRRVKSKVFKKVKEGFPLAGFLYCTSDHRMTRSSSKGCMGVYYNYYHCANSLHCDRHKADKVNEAFIDMLREVEAPSDEAETEMINLILNQDREKIPGLKSKLQAAERRSSTLQDKFIDGHLSVADYQQMRARYESEITGIKSQLGFLAFEDKELQEMVGLATNLLNNLSQIYAHAKSNEHKRDLISSTIHGKIWFDGEKCRTNAWNPAVLMLANSSKGFSEAETSGNKIYSLMSRPVPGTGRKVELFTPESSIIRLGLKQLADTFKLVA